MLLKALETIEDIRKEKESHEEIRKDKERGGFLRLVLRGIGNWHHGN